MPVRNVPAWQDGDGTMTIRDVRTGRPEGDVPPPAIQARALMRGQGTAALATALAKDGGRPYASFVTVACDHDCSPILLFSRLSDHTRNLAVDDRASLLFEAASHLDNPQSGPRVTVVGRISAADDERLRRRFLARHPAAAMYAGFGDFGFYRMTVERAHLVGGFASARWVDGRDMALSADLCADFADMEESAVAHMNADHAEAIALYAKVLLGRRGRNWRVSGIDPDGIDLRLGPRSAARLDFDRPLATASALRPALVDLARRARSAGGDGRPGNT